MSILRSASCLVAAGALLAAPQVWAQTSGTAPPGPPDQNAPQQFDGQRKKDNDRTLSERLDRGNGVIRPPAHVDPDMHQKPPPTRDSEMVRPPGEQPQHQRPK